MLAGYASIQHCLHALMYTFIHMHSHTHNTPAIAVSGIYFFELALICPFFLTLFCWRKTSSCWRFSTCLRQGTLLLGKEKSESGGEKH